MNRKNPQINNFNKAFNKFIREKQCSHHKLINKMDCLFSMYESIDRHQKAELMLSETIRINSKEICCSWFKLLKVMVLIHLFINNGVLINTMQNPLEEISVCMQRLSIQIKKKNKILPLRIFSTNKQCNDKKESIHRLLIEDFLQPYSHYLHRRCQLLPKGFKDTQKFYYLINLLNSSASMNNALYLMSRYYPQQNVFILGFNLVLAHDVQRLYDLFVQIRSENETETIGEQNDREIEDLNEKLINIFYNKYQVEYVAELAPDWIQIEKSVLERKNQNLLDVYTKQKDCSELIQTQTSISDTSIQRKKALKNSLKIDSSISSTKVNQSIDLIDDLQIIVDMCTDI